MEVNTEVVDSLHLITDSPFDQGWLVKIRMSRPEELGSLLSAEDYAAHLETEEH